MPVKRPKLSEIAARIERHLKRMENDTSVNTRTRPNAIQRYWNSRAYAAGARVFVCYVSFQGYSSLTKEQALEYLEWLEAGNSGMHWEAARCSNS